MRMRTVAWFGLLLTASVNVQTSTIGVDVDQHNLPYRSSAPVHFPLVQRRVEIFKVVECHTPLQI